MCGFTTVKTSRSVVLGRIVIRPLSRARARECKIAAITNLGCDRESGKGASVTWQDELQHLDAELAAGRISAEEYRVRRDAVVGRSQAPGTPSGGVPQQGQAGTPSGGVPKQNPFPPAFSWSNAAAQANQQSQQAGSEEATQVVHNPLAGAQPQPIPHSPQWANQAPWAAAQQGWSTPEAGTPWDDADPAKPVHGDTSWMRQGPEVFDTADSKSSKGKLIAGVSISVVLIALVAMSVFFYLNSPGTSPPQAGQNTQQQEPPKPKAPQLPAPPQAKATPANPPEVLVPPPPGTPHPFNGPIDRPSIEGPRGGLLPQTVRDFALQNGLVDGWFHGTDATTPKTTLLALRMPDENTATGVAKKYLDGQAGLADVNQLSYQGVRVVSTGTGTFRTAYVSYNWVVIVDISAPQGQQQAAQDLFKSTLDAQLAQTPPTVLR